MDWDKIRELVNSGVTIGHHTKNHLHLVNSSEKEVVNEIEDASKDFLQNLGYVPEIFAYPYGEYSYEIKQITKRYFKAAFGQQSGSIYDEIDILKGVAVVCMIIFHLFYFPNQYGFKEIEYDTVTLKTIAKVAQIIFITCVGINLVFSFHLSHLYNIQFIHDKFIN